MPGSHPNGADGVVSAARSGIDAELTTPSAPSAVASRNFIDVASTPPLRGGECYATDCDRLWAAPCLRPIRYTPFSGPGCNQRDCVPSIFEGILSLRNQQ